LKTLFATTIKGRQGIGARKIWFQNTFGY